jgi:biopolymer transport protein ExbD
MRRKRGGFFDTPGGTLNLTPLLDVIFNLIFFFVLATKIDDHREDQYLEIALPGANSGVPRAADLPEIPVIAAGKDGTLRVDGVTVSEEALVEALRTAVAERNVRQVILVSDAELTWQRVVRLTDLCRQAGIAEVAPRVAPISAAQATGS